MLRFYWKPERYLAAVCAAADREHADLLVIGRGWINASRLPTNTYAIIRKSACPVVSV